MGEEKAGNGNQEWGAAAGRPDKRMQGRLPPPEMGSGPVPSARSSMAPRPVPRPRAHARTHAEPTPQAASQPPH